jgi:transposase
VKLIMETTPTKATVRRYFDEQFKQDAVNRVVRTGKSCAEVARELGIRSNVLSRWRRERLSRADAQQPGAEELKPSELAAELRQARQELDDLREQRDISKKALSIFSQRSPSGGRR